MKSIFFVRLCTIIAFSKRFKKRNLLKTFLMNFLMILYVVRSMIFVFHFRIQFSLIRVRNSFFTTEIKIFMLTEIEANEIWFSLNLFHFVIFLTAVFAISLFNIFTWTRIQWSFMLFSQLMIWRANFLKMYWSNWFLKCVIVWMTIWLSMKMIIVVWKYF